MADDSIFRRQSLFTDPAGTRETVAATLPGMMHFIRLRAGWYDLWRLRSLARELHRI